MADKHENKYITATEKPQPFDPATRREKLHLEYKKDERNVPAKQTNRIMKEMRTVISINSNQRKIIKEDELSDPSFYVNYMTTESYEKFRELYNLAISVNNEEFIEQYEGEEITERGLNARQIECRNIVDTIARNHARAIATNVEDINSQLVNLLADIAKDISSTADEEAITNTLNSYVVSGAAHNPDSFWKPFYYTGSLIKNIVYDERLPNNYVVSLPNIISHVKSIRLLSTEIPYSINNITERNNIMAIQLRRKAVEGINDGNPVPVEIRPEKSVFNFIMVKIDPGNYTLEELLSAMEEKINSSVKEYTVKNYTNIFSIDFDKPTGRISIKCLSPELEFHMKFYSQLNNIKRITEDTRSHGISANYNSDLWYMLGFPWPYELDETYSDKYTTEMTNYINIGLHEILKEDTVNKDIFDREKTYMSYIIEEMHEEKKYFSEAGYTELNTHRVFKYPSVDIKYIYLVIKGLKSIHHINQFNNIINYKDSDIFAKILLDGERGKILFNKHIENPYIKVNALSKIGKLEILWIDERGELVDFNGIDHSFTVEFIHYVTQLKTHSYDSKLGINDTKSYPEFLSANVVS